MNGKQWSGFEGAASDNTNLQLIYFRVYFGSDKMSNWISLVELKWKTIKARQTKEGGKTLRIQRQKLIKAKKLIIGSSVGEW